MRSMVFWGRMSLGRWSLTIKGVTEMQCNPDHLSKDFLKWSEIALVLGVNVTKISSAQCGLPSNWGEVLLLEKFGAENGLVLLPDGTPVLQYADAIAANGFGFSVIEPAGHSAEYLNSLKEALRDWGWKGADSDRPEWY